MLYIQRKDENGLKAVDESTTQKEIKKMLTEYKLSDQIKLNRVFQGVIYSNKNHHNRP